jgi:hypothetical protein
MTTKTKFYVPVELSLNELIQLGIVKSNMTPKMRKALYKYIFTDWYILKDFNKLSDLYTLSDSFGFMPLNDSAEHILLPTNTRDFISSIADKWIEECFVFIQWDKTFDFFNMKYMEGDDDIMSLWSDDKIKKYIEDRDGHLIAIDRTRQGGVLYEDFFATAIKTPN